MMDDLKSANDYERYAEGWSNRVLDELELFFDGDAERNH